MSSSQHPDPHGLGNLHDETGVWAVALLKTQPDTIQVGVNLPRSRPSTWQKRTYPEGPIAVPKKKLMQS